MGFAAPFLLLFLIALPAIWWLLHVTPPAPTEEKFPPLQLLLKIANKQETPNRTPWWLLLLRLFMVAIVIFAFADPIWRPSTTVLKGNAPLVVVIDNGWSSVHDWEKRVNAALDLVKQAEAAKKTIYIAATADNDNQDIRPLNSEEATKRIYTMRPLPLPTHRLSVIKRLEAALKGEKADIAYLSDGLRMVEDGEVFHKLLANAESNILLYEGSISNLVGITSAKNESGSLSVDLVRGKADGEKILSLGAFDREGRMIADTESRFEDGETSTVSAFNLPLEMKNDIAAIKVNGQQDVASTFLSDTRNHVYRVGMVAPSLNELTQPLLSPLYYVDKALQGHVDIVAVNSASFDEAINKLTLQHPSTIILGDVVNMPEAAQQKLNRFVEDGGALIRFAGQNLASNDNEDILLPVKLRHGERQLGGVMSWATPQKLAPLPKKGIFADLAYPEDVTVSRQILAEPSPELFDHTWLSLADGTPLVTARARGKGMLIFIHTSADPTWSTLPLSGFFVDMMQRLTETGGHTGDDNSAKKNDENIAREPWQVIDINGELVPAPSTVSPLTLNDKTEALPSFNHPPGFYGQKDNLYAVNLLDKEDSFMPLETEIFAGKVRLMDYSDDVEKHLTGPLLAIAIALFALDTLVTLGASRLFSPKSGLRFSKGKFLVLALAVTVLFAIGQMFVSKPVFAEKLSANDAAMVQSAGKTRLAYVITGLDEIDDTSKTGLEALSQFLQTRTTIDPGPVAGLDLDKDELAFYPLIYWPVDANSPMPTQKAIDKINTYMRQGGTVLFDTHDQIETGMDLSGKTTANNQRLRDILNGLNIPELEQAPPDHVISRSFFIMPDFPGRYRGSPLWILSSALGGNDKRPIHAGDGVSSILITANDFAGAWAHDGKGAWKYPLVPDDEMQRVWAFRGGLNIVMYILTGNYKADQVHVPALLERLGQEKSQ